MAHQPIDRVELRDTVTLAIRDMILSGEVEPGERLVETELADRFGTSRGPVRDGLANLARTGLVTIRNRRGSFVTTFDVDDVDELYSLRISLEVLAVERAATRRSDADLERMRSALTGIKDAFAADDLSGVAEADMALHRAIVTAAAHNRLADAWEHLADQTMLMMRHLTTTRPEIQRSDGEHLRLIDAIEAGDSEGSRTALEAHLGEARVSMRERFAASS